MQCECGCGGEIIFKPHHKRYGIPKYLNGHNSKGKTHPMYDVHRFGEENPMFGKHHSQETKDVQSTIMMGKHNSPQTEFKCGIEHPHYLGGIGISSRKKNTKRRQLNFIPINESINDDEVAHHLTKEFVAYIPEFINKSVWHNIHTGKNMDEVNFYTLNYLFLVYNKKE